MGDSLVTIATVVVAAVLMLGLPLSAVADRTDDISQQAVQNATVEYVDSIRTTGKLSLEDYTKFTETIAATGNSYDIEMQVKILDENIGKKAAQTEVEKIGENVYYVMYTSQVMEQINPIDPATGKAKYPNGRTLLLKEGDIVSVSVKNTNTTIAQLLRNAMYKLTGNDTFQVGASHGGIVTINGK